MVAVIKFLPTSPEKKNEKQHQGKTRSLPPSSSKAPSFSSPFPKPTQKKDEEGKNCAQGGKIVRN